MYTKGKGISGSVIPYSRRPPEWVKYSTKEVCEHICKLAKKGMTPSQVGTVMRDTFGIGQIGVVTGSKVLRILKANDTPRALHAFRGYHNCSYQYHILTENRTAGLAPRIPEDLYHLIKKAVSVRKHLEKNRKDKDAKFRLILVESKIHRLSRYYLRTRKLPSNWKYDSKSPSALLKQA